MRPVRLGTLSAGQSREPDEPYHRARDARVRTLARMILLAAEQGLVAAEIAPIVRQDEQTVRRRFARHTAEGLTGLAGAPRPGTPPKATPEHRERLPRLARRRPRALGLPFSPWTAARLAEGTGPRMGIPGIHRPLRAGGMALSQPRRTITSPGPDCALEKRRSRVRATT